MVFEGLFWASIFLIIYAYAGYPCLLLLVTKFRDLSLNKDDFCPNVSVIIAVYNGEKVIKEKLENTLSSNYPEERLEVIVASDCSTDKTQGIVMRYQHRGVKLVVQPERKGKTIAENMAIKEARGEVLIFTDASTLIEKDAIREMIKNFADSRVGCVSGEDKSVSRDNSRLAVSEGAYVRYEMFLRRLESNVHSLVGASGCLYAARRELCIDIPGHITRDFFMPLYAREKGFITVSEPRAIAYVKAIESQSDEFQRKIRTITGGLSVLFYKRALLNPIRYGLYAFILIHHKLLRWMVPFFLVSCLAANFLLLRTDMLFLGSFIIQVMLYLFALTGLIQSYKGRLHRIFSVPFYFLMINIATLISWWKLLTNQDKAFAVWNPTKR